MPESRALLPLLSIASRAVLNSGSERPAAEHECSAAPRVCAAACATRSTQHHPPPHPLDLFLHHCAWRSAANGTRSLRGSVGETAGRGRGGGGRSGAAQRGRLRSRGHRQNHHCKRGSWEGRQREGMRRIEEPVAVVDLEIEIGSDGEGGGGGAVEQGAACSGSQKGKQQQN